jgi:hypothetical protein
MADHEADEGRVEGAIEQYERLVEKVMAAKPDVDHDLREAYSLSLLYRDLARLHRRIGTAEKAEAIDGKRLAIWNSWIQTLPGNPFVLEQLAATSR